MTIRWLALTSCRPAANGWGFRPKSRITSSGVAVTRQKFEYEGTVDESSTTTSLVTCAWGWPWAPSGVSRSLMGVPHGSSRRRARRVVASRSVGPPGGPASASSAGPGSRPSLHEPPPPIKTSPRTGLGPPLDQPIELGDRAVGGAVLGQDEGAGRGAAGGGRLGVVEVVAEGCGQPGRVGHPAGAVAGQEL